MPTIVGCHDITKGQDHWLRSPKRKELFGPLGITNIRTFVDPQNPKRVAVVPPDLKRSAFSAPGRSFPTRQPTRHWATAARWRSPDGTGSLSRPRRRLVGEGVCLCRDGPRPLDAIVRERAIIWILG